MIAAGSGDPAHLLAPAEACQSPARAPPPVCDLCVCGRQRRVVSVVQCGAGSQCRRDTGDSLFSSAEWGGGCLDLIKCI